MWTSLKEVAYIILVTTKRITDGRCQSIFNSALEHIALIGAYILHDTYRVCRREDPTIALIHVHV